MSSLAPLQQAFYTVLSGDSQLDSLITGVYDHVPEDAAHPYVTLGDATEIPENILAEFGWESTETLHVWTRERGFESGLAIQARIVTVLDHQTLTVAGRHFVSCKYEYSETLRDPDPEIRHIPVRFRVCTEQQ